MRTLLGLAAAGLAAIAAAVATVSDVNIVSFFVGLAFAGVVEAGLASSPFVRWRRYLARGLALVWLFGAAWIGVLLLWYQAACACSSPPPPPTVLIVGVPAVIYHLIGLYGSLALVLVSAFGPDRWFARYDPVVDRQEV